MKNLQGWGRFVANCQQLNNPHELNQFFELTLTPAEREKIAARYMILAELIHKDKTQREIATDLGVSIFNVTRGANQLKRIAAASQQLILGD